MMTTLFISDLHLDESRPLMTEVFLNFLKQQVRKAEALYILGDFFEVWVGDDNVTELNSRVIRALHDLTQTGVPIYLMHGNRDFLIGKKFIRSTGCQLLKDPSVINLYGTPTLLMHGDLLCTQDIEYQKFRAKARNIFYQKLFLLKSLAKRKAIAQNIRQISQEHGHSISEAIADVNPNEIHRLMLKHHVKQLIHGHTHRPSIEYFQLKGETACRIVLSDWEDQGNALIYHSDGYRQLIDLS